ncbi:T-cell immunoglobulin and mucin domain-containing protein 4-like, partial [Scomber scombrus]
MKTVSSLLVVLLAVSGSSSRKVVGRAGEDVTLPCRYNIKSNGPREVCWGRGSLSTFGCNNQIISTDGYKVIETTRASSRYQLLGRLEDGNVSLTILKTTEEDAGRYGCRVNIAGLFNDEKHHIELIIEKSDMFSLSLSPTTAATITETGSDVTTNNETTESTVTLVQESWSKPVQQVNNLQIFIGNRVKVFIIIFIPALLPIA